jgi:hypothetical protein
MTRLRSLRVGVTGTTTRHDGGGQQPAYRQVELMRTVLLDHRVLVRFVDIGHSRLNA